MSHRRNILATSFALLVACAVSACGQVETSGTSADAIVLCEGANDPDCVSGGAHDVHGGARDTDPAPDDVQADDIDPDTDLSGDVSRDDIHARDVPLRDDEVDAGDGIDADDDATVCRDDDPRCAPSCDDGVQNGDETDVDCGGPACAPCENRARCERASDCASETCAGGICVLASCTDGVQNGDETDVDCGGSCGPCAAGQRCGASADCMPAEYMGWGPCGEFAGVCGQFGTRTRDGVSSTCAFGMCATAPITETETCTRNTVGTVCGSVEYGAWTSCSGFEGTCGVEGTQSRSATTHACRDEVCAPTESTETRTCTRDTQGTTCGAVETGSWSVCSGFEGICGTAGTQTRAVTSPLCVDGACSSGTVVETRACTRTTNDAACGDTHYGSWTTCSYGAACATTGTRTRNVTRYTCSDGSCASATTIETGTCHRTTNGTTCGTTHVGSWSVCGTASGVCGTTGTQTRDVTTYTCSEGGCAASTTTETQACALNANGATCGTTEYGSWSACTGFSGTCGNSGIRSRTVTTYTCVDGSCQASTSTEVEACTRNTNGISCGTTQFGPWSACGGFSGTCDTTGTRTRSVSTYACASGACTSSTSTETGSCTRDTNGATCRSTSVTYGPCESDTTCSFSGTRDVTTTSYQCHSGTCHANPTTETHICGVFSECSPCLDGDTPGLCLSGSCSTTWPGPGVCP